MQIKLQNGITKQFQAIACGTCFAMDGVYYMKVRGSMLSLNYGANLATGEVNSIPDESVVYVFPHATVSLTGSL